MRLEGRALAHEGLATMNVVVSHMGFPPGLLATVAQLDRKQASCGSAAPRAGSAVDGLQLQEGRRLGRHRWTIQRTGAGWVASDECGSATSVTRSRCLRWCCWPARSRNGDGRAARRGIGSAARAGQGGRIPLLCNLHWVERAGEDAMRRWRLPPTLRGPPWPPRTLRRAPHPELLNMACRIRATGRF
jgi:hypothetical protein